MTSKKLLIVLGTLFLIWFIYTIITFKPLTDEERQARRLEAYNYAVECSGTKEPKLKFEEIKWFIVPGNSITYKATDGIAVLDGYFQISDNTIWMPSGKKDVFWIMAHESLHAIGYIGHPDHPFRTCRLMADQN